MAFWRRTPRGRHAVGAPQRVPAPAAAPLTPSPPTPVRPAAGAYAAPAGRVIPAPAANAAEWPSAPAVAPYTPVEPPVAVVPSSPRVELTFRDGSSAELYDEDARALEEIAALLTGRDGVKH